MFHEVLVVNLLRADTRDLVSMTMAFAPLGCLCDDRFTGVLFISSISDGLSYGYMIPSLIPVVVCHLFHFVAESACMNTSLKRMTASPF